MGEYSQAFTYDACMTMIEAGADAIEIGLPFSDPIADGPVIQASHQRALTTGEDVSVDAGFRLLARLQRAASLTPILLMGSVNLPFTYGYDAFFKEASKQGCAGVVLPDCPVEMATPVLTMARQYAVPMIQLLSPACTPSRLEAIVDAAEGFIYMISSLGITGERASFSSQLSQCMTQVRQRSGIPLVVGFGVSTPEHVTSLTTVADGVIVGSHFVSCVAEQMPHKKQALAALNNRVRQFKQALCPVST